MQIRLNALRRSRLHLCREWKCAKDLIPNAFPTNGLECISWQRCAVITTLCKSTSTRYARKYQRMSRCNQRMLFQVLKIYILFRHCVYILFKHRERCYAAVYLIMHVDFEMTGYREIPLEQFFRGFNITKGFEDVHRPERRFYFAKGKC